MIIYIPFITMLLKRHKATLFFLYFYSIVLSKGSSGHIRSSDLAAPPSRTRGRIQLFFFFFSCCWKSTPPPALREEWQWAGATGLDGVRSFSQVHSKKWGMSHLNSSLSQSFHCPPASLSLCWFIFPPPPFLLFYGAVFLGFLRPLCSLSCSGGKPLRCRWS